MDNDKEREKAIKFMEENLVEGRDYIKHGDLKIVHMRIHEDDMPGFTEALFKTIDRIQLMSN